jgi:hypothetical protein
MRLAMLMCCAFLSLFSLWMSQGEDEPTVQSPAATIDARTRATPDPAGGCKENLLGRLLRPTAYTLRSPKKAKGAAPVPHFEQVRSHSGAVALSLLQDALTSLFRAFAGGKVLAHEGNSTQPRKIVVYAVDGTLLNLLRWGHIVNDNDLDIGFHVEGLSLGPASTMEHYYTLLRALADEGLILPLTSREEQRLHASRGAVKRGRCKHRGQLMQCILTKTGVMVDFFGPETMYAAARTGLEPAKDVLPLVHCRAFQAEFPCPYNYERVLKRFTLDMSRGGAMASSSSGEVNGRVWYEFDGCALFPRRSDEHSAAHLESILASQQALHVCGYPSLGFELRNAACVALASAVNVTLGQAAAEDD